MKVLKLLAVPLCFFVAACEIIEPMPALTPLEIQNMQTRDYEYRKDIVFPSVMSVFQDLGYTVASADNDTGFITAESASSSTSNSFLLEMAKVSKTKDTVLTTSQTKATAFIEEVGSITKVRLNFVNTMKKSYAHGQSDQQDTPVLNATIYQNAFERIESAIFVRSSN
ncbi:MAG: hypothetical protein ACJA04_000366 [Cellvibrionaceae bacterium]|jgi:hypothetical protein